MVRPAPGALGSPSDRPTRQIIGEWGRELKKSNGMRAVLSAKKSILASCCLSHTVVALPCDSSLRAATSRDLWWHDGPAVNPPANQQPDVPARLTPSGYAGSVSLTNIPDGAGVLSAFFFGSQVLGDAVVGGLFPPLTSPTARVAQTPV